MFESDPFASENAVNGPEIFEGDLHAVHRIILEYEEIKQRRGKQHIQLPIDFHLSPIEFSPSGRLTSGCLSDRV
jgi:hypothetical protein